MKKIRYLAAGVVLLAALSLTGCQLAMEEAAAQEEGRFVGFFLTAECLLDSDLLAEDGRIYGQIEGELPSETTSPEEEVHCVFPGLSGIGFYQISIQFGEDPKDAVWIPDLSSALQDRHTNGQVTEEGNMETSIQGTLYIAPQADRYPAYANRIYQLSNQEIYLIPEELPLGDGPLEAGCTVSAHHVESYAISAGETKTLTADLTITGYAPIEKVIWTQLDQNHQIAARREYAPEEVPEILIPEASTAYIIVERFQQGEPVPDTREIITPEDGVIPTLVLQPEGYYLGQDTEIQWEV